MNDLAVLNACIIDSLSSHRDRKTKHKYKITNAHVRYIQKIDLL